MPEETDLPYHPKEEMRTPGKSSMAERVHPEPLLPERLPTCEHRCVHQHLQLAVLERPNGGRALETREAIQGRSRRDSADNGARREESLSER